MAQRMIHYLMGVLMLGEIPALDRKRFLTGTILPDAYEDVRQRDLTHYTSTLEDGTTCYDFEHFREMYGQRLAEDDLYAGYYMHIVEDDLYRCFIRRDHKLDVYGTPGHVEKLHMDYRLLNVYIRERYRLSDELTVPAEVENEPLLKRARFAVRPFMESFAEDFTEEIRGETVFLSEQLLDEFMERYLPMAKEELAALRQGRRYLKASDWSWIRKRPPLG